MFAEHVHLASLDDLHADNRAHQRGLAAPAWAEQTRHRPAGDLQVETVEHGAPAAHDMQILDLDGRVGHLAAQAIRWVLPALRIGRVQVWELDRLRVAAHHPQILRSDEDANRVIALLLPQGEALQEHQVHEHALVFVLRGELLVSAGASERTLSAPSLIHFDPGERHEVRAISECQLVLCLAPWPGPGHPSHTAAA